MSKREAFLLRIDPKVLQAIRKWSDDEMRSINGQIEYVLRNALRQSGRSPGKESNDQDDSDSCDEASTDAPDA